MELPKDRKDLADKHTRDRASASERLTWICDRAAGIFGADPRGGRFSLVGQPSVVEYVTSQLRKEERELQRAIVIGEIGGEIVAWWTPAGGGRIPMRVSHRANGSMMWCVPDDLLVRFDQVDRRAAGEVRVALHKGEIRIHQ